MLDCGYQLLAPSFLTAGSETIAFHEAHPAVFAWESQSTPKAVHHPVLSTLNSYYSLSPGKKWVTVLKTRSSWECMHPP